MNHYLTAKESEWWKPTGEAGSPIIEKLIQEHWDQGPFQHVHQWMSELKAKMQNRNVVELGCGVGGLYRKIKNEIHSYLGIDQSFLSIALARHLNCGSDYPLTMQIPVDLFTGMVSRKIQLKVEKVNQDQADWVVANLENPPLQLGCFEVSIALNTIDMLEKPIQLPEIQKRLLVEGGVAIQSCPYVWNERIIKKLRHHVPLKIDTSAKLVEFLYEKTGFKILNSKVQIPWIFFKNARQIELYSVHAFMASLKK